MVRSYSVSIFRVSAVAVKQNKIYRVKMHAHNPQRMKNFFCDASLQPNLPYSLRKHAYSNILKILPPEKRENFQIKNLLFFIFLLKTDIVGTC